jgi:hypothetical protein
MRFIVSPSTTASLSTWSGFFRMGLGRFAFDVFFMVARSFLDLFNVHPDPTKLV